MSKNLKERKISIGFWASNNNFNFLDEIINKLEDEFVVKKFLIGGNLEAELRSVDVAWFEWANGPLIEATNFEGIGTPIICRLHKYEAYIDVIRNVKWSRVSKLIFIAESVKSTFERRYPKEFSLVDSVVIRNGVDLNKFNADLTRPWGKKFAFIGAMNYHKNPSLLLQCMSELYKKDKGVSLNLVGDFPDPVLEEYFWDQAKKLKISKIITHEGRNENIEDWLKDKDYLLLPSIIEGQSVASLEAMACGVKPIIHNYYQAESLYPKEFLFSSIDDFLTVASRIQSRKDINEIVNENNDLDKQIVKIKELILDATNSKWSPEKEKKDSFCLEIFRRVVPFQIRKKIKEILKNEKN